MTDETDETLLLDLLNTKPVVNGVTHDGLGGLEEGRVWLTRHGQPATEDEWQALRDARTALQALVRGQQNAASVTRFVDGASYRPALGGDGLIWTLDLPQGRSAAARAVLAWDALRRSSPGRLRPCANPECELFLVDHSKSNGARWCSMAVCGNRLKARRHYDRTRKTKD